MAATGVFGLTRFTGLAAGDVLPAVDISDSTQNAHGSLDAITVTNFFSSIPVPVVVTSASANALAVGLAGSSNSAFLVDCSTALQVAGLKVTGAVTGGTVAVVVTDSGLNASLTVNAKGSGTIGIGSVSTGRVTITPVTTITGSLTLSAALVYGGVTLSNAVTGTGNMVLSAGPTLTGTLTAAIANFSGAVSTAGLTCTTLAGTGAVSGFTTADFSGNVTITKASGNSFKYILAQTGVVTWNLTNIATTGLFQIDDGVTAAFSIAKTTYAANFAASVTVANGFTVSAGTTAVQALTATAISLSTSGNPQLLVETSGAGNNPSLRLKASSTTWDVQGTFSNADDELVFLYGGATRATFGGVGGGLTLSAGISCTTGTFSGAVQQASSNALTGSTSVPSAAGGTDVTAIPGKGGYILYGVASDNTMWAGSFVAVNESGTSLSSSGLNSGGGLSCGPSADNLHFNFAQVSGGTKTIKWRYLRID